MRRADRDAPLQLPDRDTLIEQMVAIRDSSEAAEHHARFVSQEVRVALYAVVQAHNALARKEPLGSLQFQRLLTECALRLAWVAGEFTVADQRGRPVVDPAGARVRLDGLLKRDLLNLADASKAIHGLSDSEAPLAAELEARAAAIDARAAPKAARDLANTTIARSAYAAHRLCSSLIHAGAGIPRISSVPESEMNGRIDMAAYLSIACADAILRSMGLDAGIAPQ